MSELKLVVFDFDGVFTNCNYKVRDVNCKDTYGLLLLNKLYKIGICTRSNGDHIPDIIKSRIDFVINNCTSKYEKIMELGYKENEIAYMGDDTHDLECIKKFKYSACPKDAHPEVLKKARFISKFNGGKGAVREFSDHIISHDGGITAIIPVRSGSTRCKNKNIRDFGDTNLLKLKIENLKNVKGITQIMVSSNDPEMLKIAEENGAIPVKRDPKYCTTLCSGSDMYCALAEAVNTNVMLYTHCVCPFIKKETYESMIDIWKNEREYDSIMTAHELKEYLWYNNKPLNYEYRNAPPSQTINGYYIPTFGACIVKKDFVLENRNIIGFNPYFYKVNQLEAVDIDTPFEFYSAELLYNNNIRNIEDINKKMNKKKINDSEVKLLDCTIRDGGYLNNWNFTDEEVIDMYRTVTESGFEYFEIGFRTNKRKLAKKGKWCYSTEDDINNIVKKYKGCKIAVMAKLGTVNVKNFVKKEKSNIDLVRVLVPHNDKNRVSIIDDKLINECYTLCTGLLKLGYKICLNFACFNHVTNIELENVMTKLKDVKLEYLYIADTYGNLDENNIEFQLERLYKYNIPIGLHLHNFRNDALFKLKTALKTKSVSIIDSCINGMGRGLGNLKSEEVLIYLKRDYKLMLEHVDKNFNNRKELLYYLAAEKDIHPDFIRDILKKENLSIRKILSILDHIKNETERINKKNYHKNMIDNLV